MVATLPLTLAGLIPFAVSRASGIHVDDSSLVQVGRPWDLFHKKLGVVHIGPEEVELVVASTCEDTSWFSKFYGPVTLYNKGGAKCEASLLQVVNAKEQERVEQHGRPANHSRVVTLLNRGREGQSYIQHIVDNYDRLAPYTAFAQGSGEHNGVKVMDKLKQFMSSGDRTTPVVPIVHENDAGHILYRDADPDEKVDINREGLDTSNVYVFPFGGAPVADKARALYMALFGGTACDAPPMNFAAGAQFIVSREAIRSKPKAFYEHVATELAKARCEELGYVLERLWLFLFDPTIKAADTLAEFPDYCEWRGGRLHNNRGDCKEYKKSLPVKNFRDIQNNPWRLFKTLTIRDR